MPHNVYMQVRYIILDYGRMTKQRNEILYSSSSPDGQPRGTGIGDTTANKATQLVALNSRIEAIDNVVHDMHAKYCTKIKRDDVNDFDPMDAFLDYNYYCYVLYNPDKDKQPVSRTWNRYRANFIYQVAQKLNLI